jgi:chromate transporter
MTIKRVRYFIFLKDVFFLSLTAFGGPQGHLAMFIERLVVRRAYLSEEDLLELYALCQILPGPTSTQTITSIGYRIGGATLAYLTLLIWMLPAVTLMTVLAILVVNFEQFNISLDFLRFIQPIAVGIVAFSAYRISTKVIVSNLGIMLMLLAAVGSFLFPFPFVLPIFLVLGGFVTSLNYKKYPREDKQRMHVKWDNFFLWGGVLVLAAAVGAIFDFRLVRLFENFYRNGSLIFGGGQVLVPLIYTEFVEFKRYLTSEEFISGYGVVQALPGPVFSFSGYVGALSMRDAGFVGQIAGSFVASMAIFLPGTFLIFFVSRFWNELKKYRAVRASMEGVHAVSSGMVIAATVLLLVPMQVTYLNYALFIGTALTLYFTKVPAPFIILAGLILGIAIS